MRKKVLVVSSYPAPYRVAVFQGLSREYDLDVFFDTQKNENRNADWFCKSGALTFHVLDNDETRGVFDRVVKQIKQYDFVLAYDSARKPTMRAMSACKRHKIPYFINIDGWIYHKDLLRRAAKRLIRPHYYRTAAGFFCSGKAAANCARFYGAKEDRIFYHPFSSLTEEDILNAPAGEAEKKEQRKALGIEEKVTVLTIGQFIPRKGFDILIRAWKGIDDAAQLLIIGGGDDRPMYEQMIAEQQIKGITIIDFMPKAELFRYYKAADLFVLPTREDIWGLVINEAMAQGLPVISTDNCVAGLELIENGVNGYIVKTESVEELREKMLLLIGDPQTRAEMAKNNLKKIAPYTMENVAKSHIKAINQVMGFGGQQVS